MLSSMIEVRVLTTDDWRQWRSLRLAALEEAPSAFGSRLADWQGDGDREARWRDRLGIPGSHNLVALLEGEPVGMGSGVPTDDGQVELISLWVSPNARGRGVGDAILAEVERWARERGAGVLLLDVAEDNEGAARLYLRHGFAWTGELGELMADGVRRERVMAKPLDDRGGLTA